MIEIKDLAMDIQTRMNDISDDMHSDIAFKITDNAQEYDTWTQLVDGETRYNFTPAIVRVVSPIVPSEEIGLYQGLYRVEFYGYEKELRLVEAIVNQYTSTYSGIVTTISGKVTGLSSGVLVLNDAPVEPEDGYAGLGDRFTGYMDVNVVVSLKGELNMGKSSIVKIDDVPVFYTDISYINDKSKLNTVYNPEMADTKLVAETLLISFLLPVAEVVEDNVVEDDFGSKKINQLFSEGLSASYNQKHKIQYKTKQHDKTRDYVLRKMEFNHSKSHTPVSFTLTFEQALETEPYLINGQALNILACTYSNGTSETPSVRRDGQQVAKNVLESSVKAWSMTIEHDNSPLSTQLLALLVGDFDLDNEFTLTEKIRGWDYDKFPDYDEDGEKLPKPDPFLQEYIENEYSVCVKNGGYSKGSDGVMVYELTFVEKE